MNRFLRGIRQPKVLYLARICCLLLLANHVEASGSMPTSGMDAPSGVIMIVALPDGAEGEEYIREWNSFAGSIGNDTELGVHIVCQDAEQMHLVSSLDHVMPLQKPTNNITWARVLHHVSRDYPHEALMGLSAEGTLPSAGLEDCIVDLAKALSESPEPSRFVISRTKVTDVWAGGEGQETWLSDMLVAQLWLKSSILSEELLISARLGRAQLGKASLLEVISLLLEARVTGVHGNLTEIPVVDGTDSLRAAASTKAPALWCNMGRGTRLSANYVCQSPIVTVNRARMPDHVEPASNIVKNVDFSIGALGTAFGSSPSSDASHKHSLGTAIWPPPYVLETASSREGLVLVTSVNCGFLDMALNFFATTQEHSDAKVRVIYRFFIR